MNHEEREDVRDEVDRLIGGIPRDVDPPPGLRREVLARLGATGLVRRRAPLWRRSAPWAAAAAGLLLAFATGRASVGVVGGDGDVGVAAPPQNRYLLLLYEDARFDAGALGPDDLVSAYSDWARRARSAGVLEMAEKLADAEVVLEGGGATARGVGQGAAPGVLTGFFLVTAPDREAAVALARETPHYRFGGTVLVRGIDPTPGGPAG